MNAPLSRYLTSFSVPSALAASPTVAAKTSEPMVTLAVAELEARLGRAREDALASAEAVHTQTLETLADQHKVALDAAAATALGERVTAEAEALLVCVADAFTQLRETLAEATAKVLRPLVANALRERALAALDDAIARLVADADRPALTLRAPADLVVALRARGVPPGVELSVADVADATVTFNGTSIETRLAAALADVADAIAATSEH